MARCLLLLFLIAVPLAADAAEPISDPFAPYVGCFMLSDVSSGRIVLDYNPENRCRQRIPVDSTFKIPLALMALDTGIVEEDTQFPWDGQVQAAFPDWNRNQTLRTWQRFSVVWVSQQMTPKIGLARIKAYLASFGYGNQDFSGDPGKDNGLTNAWLSSSLQASAEEQLGFLARLERHELSVARRAVEITKTLIFQGKLPNGADCFAKTGSGWTARTDSANAAGKLRDGWYVGIVEKGEQKFVFAANISDRTPDPTSAEFGGQIAKRIALQILNGYFRE